MQVTVSLQCDNIKCLGCIDRHCSVADLVVLDANGRCCDADLLPSDFVQELVLLHGQKIMAVKLLKKKSGSSWSGAKRQVEEWIEDSDFA
jgi:hypothetical protein